MNLFDCSSAVQTTFQSLKINAEVFGSFTLITKPGNCSGLYSVLLKVDAIFPEEYHALEK